MCGLAGFIQLTPNTHDAEATVRAMAATLVRRGPDDEGVWVDRGAGIALGHRRLSVLDLSSGGHQPMASADGRYVIAYNGEIYNHSELRKALVSYPWRGHSDTEVLLAAITVWGVEQTLKRSVGMFAFAVWDRERKRLILARDRLGEKPLYYGMQRDAFLFGSELKALHAHPAWVGEVDRSALAAYVRYAYVPAPMSIFKGIHKLSPGCWMEVDPANPAVVVPQAYWSAQTVANAARSQPFQGDASEAQAVTLQLLRQAVQGQREADVPLGTFLSGGIDSSLITALLVEQSQQPVQSFTIGFREQGYDEAPFAAQIARHLGTAHTELYVTDAEARAVIPTLPDLYDEPFADSSQIPTYLVAKMARAQVTVALSGDGGDELFGGYNRYAWATRIWRRTGGLPQGVRGAMAALLQSAPPQAWDRLFNVLPARTRPPAAGDKLHKMAQALQQNSPQMLYRQLASLWPEPGQLVSANEPSSNWMAAWDVIAPDFTQQMMLADTVSYLPDDIMVKVDRAAMGVSLETRAPYLDHRLFELAWRLPLSMKIRDGQSKWILRRLLDRYVPSAMLDRPKQGFGVPIDTWLRGPLRAWAEALLDEERLRREGWFNPALICQAWREHLSGKRNWQHRLWVILMFQAWQERWL